MIEKLDLDHLIEEAKEKRESERKDKDDDDDELRIQD
jgi:hypothetical protein